MTAPSHLLTPGQETRALGWRERLARVPMPSERLTHALLVVLVLVVAILTVAPWPVGAFQDDAMYTVLAKSLAEGKGYRFLNLPGEPNATHFPPGYPLFPHKRDDGENRTRLSGKST